MHQNAELMDGERGSFPLGIEEDQRHENGTKACKRQCRTGFLILVILEKDVGLLLGHIVHVILLRLWLPVSFPSIATSQLLEALLSSMAVQMLLLKPMFHLAFQVLFCNVTSFSMHNGPVAWQFFTSNPRL